MDIWIYDRYMDKHVFIYLYMDVFGYPCLMIYGYFFPLMYTLQASISKPIGNNEH